MLLLCGGLLAVIAGEDDSSAVRQGMLKLTLATFVYAGRAIKNEYVSCLLCDGCLR